MLPFGMMSSAGNRAVTQKASTNTPLFMQLMGSYLESLNRGGGGGGGGGDDEEEDTGDGAGRILTKDERRDLSRQRIESQRRASYEARRDMGVKTPEEQMRAQDASVVRNMATRGVADETLRALGMDSSRIQSLRRRAEEYGSTDPNIPRRNPEAVEAIDRSTNAAVQDPYPTAVDQLINGIFKSGPLDKPMITPRGVQEAPRPEFTRPTSGPMDNPGGRAPQPLQEPKVPPTVRRPPPPPVGSMEYAQWLDGDYSYIPANEDPRFTDDWVGMSQQADEWMDQAGADAARRFQQSVDAIPGYGESFAEGSRDWLRSSIRDPLRRGFRDPIADSLGSMSRDVSTALDKPRLEMRKFRGEMGEQGRDSARDILRGL